jgi:hypothetical protein
MKKRRNCSDAHTANDELRRRTNASREEATMRQVTRMHRTLTVLAVGLLALAAPLVAYADGGPMGG